MANTKKKDVANAVTNAVTNALPFTKEMDDKALDLFTAEAKTDSKRESLAEMYYDAGIKAEAFYLFTSNDEKEAKRLKDAFSLPMNAHVRKLAALGKYGEAGYKLMVMPKEIRPESQKEKFREIIAWVNGAVERLAKTLRSVEESEKEQNGETRKREKDTLLMMLDGKIADLMKSALTYKGRHDINAADAALILRECRKELKALATPAK